MSDASDSDSAPHATYTRTHHPAVFPAYLYPTGTFALDGIALRAALLGFVCALSLNLAWTFRASFPQLPLFITILSFFHFMEFWITARYNTRRAKTEGAHLAPLQRTLLTPLPNSLPPHLQWRSLQHRPRLRHRRGGDRILLLPQSQVPLRRHSHRPRPPHPRPARPHLRHETRRQQFQPLCCDTARVGSPARDWRNLWVPHPPSPTSQR